MGHNIPFEDIGDDETPASVGPIELSETRQAVQIACGNVHVCAVLDNGRIKCWGDNWYWQPGYDETTIEEDPPEASTYVQFAAGLNAVQVACGYDYSCALFDNGDVRCWGKNDEGQLGYGFVT